jgi:hypothetical protein
MADNWWEDTSWMEGIEDDTSFLDDDATNYYGADDLSWLDDLDTSFLGDDIDMDSDWWKDTSWMDGIEDDTSFLDMFDDTNYYGADQDMSSNIDYNDLFDKEGNFTGYSYESPFTPGDDEESGGNKFLEFLNMMTGNIGQNPKRKGNKMGAVGQGLGDFLSSPLAALLLINQKNKDSREQMNIPRGQEAYGSGAGIGSLPDYRISNIQPALLPGMAYANQPTTFNADPPPGMQAGGLASHNHPQLHSHGSTHPDDAVPGMPGARRLPFRPKFGTPEYEALMNNGMQSGGIASLENRMDGPGDITQAMLEPGEFVMTRKATENLTPEYLYKLMHQAENAGRMR